MVKSQTVKLTLRFAVLQTYINNKAWTPMYYLQTLKNTYI